jgi:hypothetical protein
MSMAEQKTSTRWHERSRCRRSSEERRFAISKSVSDSQMSLIGILLLMYNSGFDRPND